MPFSKGSGSAGKKQSSMPSPNSAAYKKLAARKAAKATAKCAKRKSARKRGGSSAAFSSEKSRQMVVERVKSQIWGSVLVINDAIIRSASGGNLSAAKALFDFAGVYSLPEPEAEPVAAKVEPPPAAAAAVTATASPAPEAVEDPVDAFFRSIGVGPQVEAPPPERASAGL